MTITRTLAEFAHAPVVGACTAREFCELSLFDWAICGVAGWQHSGFQNWAAVQSGPGDQPTFSGQAHDPATAALINGTIAHALDFDDTHFGHIGHPSVAVWSAVHAVAKTQTWSERVDAALVGMEASVRVGQWFGRGHYEIGYHQTATAGAFGATLAVARLLGLTLDQTIAAIGLCATMASGLKSQFGTMGKPLNAGLAARTGVEAAMWAKAGLMSCDDGLAGALGFGPTHHGQADTSALRELGSSWRFETINYKFHACCHGLHAMLEALSTLDVAQDFDRLEIETHPRWMSVCNIETPRTGLECKFSYRQTAAMAINGEDTGAISSYTDECAAQFADIRGRIDVTENSDLTEMQATVRVTRGGDVTTARHDLSAAIPASTIKSKLDHKATALFGRSFAEELRAACDAQDIILFETLIATEKRGQ